MKMKKLSVKALMSLILSAILFCMPIGAFLQTGQILWRFMRRIQQSRKQKVRQRKAVQKAQRPVMITRTVPVVEKSHRAVHREYNGKFHRRHNRGNTAFCKMHLQGKMQSVCGG